MNCADETIFLNTKWHKIRKNSFTRFFAANDVGNREEDRGDPVDGLVIRQLEADVSVGRPAGGGLAAGGQLPHLGVCDWGQVLVDREGVLTRS